MIDHNLALVTAKRFPSCRDEPTDATHATKVKKESRACRLAVEAAAASVGGREEGGSERLQGCTAGPKRPQLWSTAQRAAVNEQEGAVRE